MVNLPYHTTKGRTIFTLYDLRYFMQTKSRKSAFLIYWSTNFTFNLFDLYCCHSIISYPLNTLSILIPRVLAMVYASRNCVKATIVALTRL
ncbi:unknown [Prevotella sp. CAG:1185]|nr:unknown [Prevotella sp. CAG:1185]